MVKGTCLKCGGSGHAARNCLENSADGQSIVAPVVSQTKVAAVSSPVLPVAKTLSLASPPPPVVPKSAPRVVAVDWRQRAEAWLARKQEIVFDECGWTAFKPVLVALGLGWKHPKRYLEKDSD